MDDSKMVRDLRVDAREEVHTYATAHITAPDREEFISLVLDDLRRLHDGVIARYRLKPSQFAAWTAALRKELGK
ncbi:MAG: hypothetical protein JRH20_27960 [Deltaproteobacteria bacterium]|nr:hypothetical protein [Deltaproteobacteria bacterium]